MKPHELNPRTTALVAADLRRRAAFVMLCLFPFAMLWQAASAQKALALPAGSRGLLTTQQVVSHLVQMNLNRREALHAYQGTRIYRVKYQGFLGTRSAEMVVTVKYLSPGKKEFVIQSATGSTLIIDKVLRKLLEAEKEESSPEVEGRSALTNANYRFTLSGYESTSSGSMYVLNVEPRRKDTFLYRGRIWVNAEDFAVERLEAEPARNPSFWTKKTDIVQVYTKVGDFWLPANTNSATNIRLGGRADLSIDYKNYEITNASQVSRLATPQAAVRAQADHAAE